MTKRKQAFNLLVNLIERDKLEYPEAHWRVVDTLKLSEQQNEKLVEDYDYYCDNPEEFYQDDTPSLDTSFHDHEMDC